MLILPVEGQLTQSPREVALAMIDLAQRLQVSVRCACNGTILLATPDMTEADMKSQYDCQINGPKTKIRCAFPGCIAHTATDETYCTTHLKPAWEAR